jgi:hypothetical protein
MLRLPDGLRDAIRGVGAARVAAARRMCLCAAIAAGLGCGGSQHAADGEGPVNRAPGPAPAAADPRTPIERRRDAACDQLGPKITACAVADARADLASGKIDQRQFTADTAPEVQHKNTEEFVRACKKAQYSSRQVRVLEVCLHEETQCAPLLDCLGHLRDRPGK